nr:MAG TPA: hypothetical protein [Bacteriophage sp.]
MATCDVQHVSIKEKIDLENFTYKIEQIWKK